MKSLKSRIKKLFHAMNNNLHIFLNISLHKLNPVDRSHERVAIEKCVDLRALIAIAMATNKKGGHQLSHQCSNCFCQSSFFCSASLFVATFVQLSQHSLFTPSNFLLANFFMFSVPFAYNSAYGLDLMAPRFLSCG